MIGEEFVFLSFSYLKLSELGVEVTFSVQRIGIYAQQGKSAEIATSEQLL